MFMCTSSSAGFDLLLHGIETVDDLFGLVGRDDALTAQHTGMGLGTADVLGIEGAVIGLGIGIGGHGFFGTFGEAADPALIGAHGTISLPREGPVYALRRAMTGGRKRRRPVRDADGAAFRMEKTGRTGLPVRRGEDLLAQLVLDRGVHADAVNIPNLPPYEKDGEKVYPPIFKGLKSTWEQDGKPASMDYAQFIRHLVIAEREKVLGKEPLDQQVGNAEKKAKQGVSGKDAPAKETQR